MRFHCICKSGKKFDELYYFVPSLTKKKLIIKTRLLTGIIDCIDYAGIKVSFTPFVVKL